MRRRSGINNARSATFKCFFLQRSDRRRSVQQAREAEYRVECLTQGLKCSFPGVGYDAEETEVLWYLLRDGARRRSKAAVSGTSRHIREAWKLLDVPRRQYTQEKRARP